MAFESRDLSVLAYANGFTLWYYRTPDSVEALTAARSDGSASGYFDSARALLRSGDQIIANLVGDGRITVANIAVTTVDPVGAVGVALIGSSGAAPKTATAA